MTTARAYGGKRRGRKSKPLPYDPDAWATPQWLFDELNAEFHFTLDVCAAEENKKCPLYFTASDDGLNRDWTLDAGGDASPATVFMNPPYSQVDKWLEKAHTESRKGNTVVALIKADTSTKWWHRWWREADEVRFLKRIQFDPPPGYDRKVGSPNMGHAVLVFRGKK